MLKIQTKLPRALCKNAICNGFSLVMAQPFFMDLFSLCICGLVSFLPSDRVLMCVRGHGCVCVSVLPHTVNLLVHSVMLLRPVIHIHSKHLSTALFQYMKCCICSSVLWHFLAHLVWNLNHYHRFVLIIVFVLRQMF